MGKVFAVLAVLLVVGCADVGEDLGAEDSAANAKNKLARIAAQADAGQAPVLEQPYDDEPVAVAGAVLNPAPKTGSDAAVAPVLPVADAGAMSDPEPTPEPTTEPTPAPAPAPDAGPAKHWLDGRTVSITNRGRRGSSRLLFTIHMREDGQTAVVTVYDVTGTVELAKGNGYQTAIDKWSIDTASVGGTYRFEASMLINDQEKKLTGSAFARENGIDWTSASAGLKPL